MTTVIFGEAMLEYHTHGGDGLRYGGDTLNTAIHLARAGHEVAYATAVGTDPISDRLVEAWSAEGIDTSYVLRHPDRNPGIYAIHLDKYGERSFLYWRDQSAARDMFALDGIEAAMDHARSARLLYFSLISLAVVGVESSARLVDLASERKQAGKASAYDSNFRPALWPSLAEAQTASLSAMRACTIGLPTNSDECQLWGQELGETDIANKWKAAGAELVAVKAAEKGCVLADAGLSEPLTLGATPVSVVDSSGAGDSFNAGFLGAWLHGQPAPECVEAGQSSARKTLQHQGAIAFDPE